MCITQIGCIEIYINNIPNVVKNVPIYCYAI